MKLNYASIARPRARSKQPATPHGYSLLTAHLMIVFSMLALAGCATAPPAPVRVNMPVMVPCVDVVPAKSVFEFDKLTLEATPGEKVLALARDSPRGRKYEDALEAIIQGCLSGASSPPV